MPHELFYMNGFDRASNRNEEFSASELGGSPSFSNNAWNYQPAYGSYGRFLLCGSVGDMIRIEAPSPAPPAICAGFQFGTNMAQPTSRMRILDFFDDATASAALALDLVFNPSTGMAHAELMAGAVLIGRAENAVGTGGNRWCWISLLASPHETSGVARLRINGQVVLDVSGRTVASAGMQYSRIRAGQISVTGSGTQVFFDNFVLSSCQPSDPPLYEVRVVTGTSYQEQQAQWTANTGTNASAVGNETPDGDLTYVSGNTAGLTDLFSASVWPATSGEVLGVRISAVARRDDAGLQVLRNVLRIGGQVYEGSAEELGSTYFRHATLWTRNPSTGQAWQPSEVGQALVFGYRIG